MVVQELCRQQWEMYQQRQHRIEDRIVNIDQPHVPPLSVAKPVRKWNSVPRLLPV
ncbi:hypothetical protein [Novibacillus thermophilus]|uniref:hypothetical protein n=1 Tax=Novibacillus thermophilus TaxID=1471761 RepID=UPI0014760B10|nr:hypothetical protein [Novibacillus thermophilus]